MKLKEVTRQEFESSQWEQWKVEFNQYMEVLVKYGDVNFTMDNLKYYDIEYYDKDNNYIRSEGCMILVNQDNAWKMLIGFFAE